MPTINQINQFIDAQPLAIVGVSRNPKKFGYTAYKELKDKGMNVVPVNPMADQIMGEKSYRNIADLPSDIQGIIIFTKKTQTASVVREARSKGIRHIWIQQMADSKEAIDELKGTDINLITGECILMHYKPNGMHKFHRTLNRLFGRFPK
jgi:uncharacterized protein